MPTPRGLASPRRAQSVDVRARAGPTPGAPPAKESAQPGPTVVHERHGALRAARCSLLVACVRAAHARGAQLCECSYAGSGCSWKGSLAILQDHLQVCPFVRVMCACGETVARSDIVVRCMCLALTCAGGLTALQSGSHSSCGTSAADAPNMLQLVPAASTFDTVDFSEQEAWLDAMLTGEAPQPAARARSKPASTAAPTDGTSAASAASKQNAPSGGAPSPAAQRADRSGQAADEMITPRHLPGRASARSAAAPASTANLVMKVGARVEMWPGTADAIQGTVKYVGMSAPPRRAHRTRAG
jgi:hypothetical protein